MAERRHTPGPWEITSISQDTGDIGVGHRDQRILIASVTNAASFGDMLTGAMRRGGGEFRQEDASTQFANANLIAAAPDLLAALKAMLRHSCVADAHSEDKDAEDHDAERMARAAIAKAGA